jgi:hypothetical protein
VSASQNAEKSKKQLPSAERTVEVINLDNEEYTPSESTITGRSRKK